MADLNTRLDAALRLWGKYLVSDMRNSITAALKEGAASKKTGVKHGWSTPTESNLSASVDFNIQASGNGVVFNLTMSDYWAAVDKGRSPSGGGGNGAVRRGMGKDWMAKVGINARTVLQDITQRYYDKKGIKRKAKPLSYDKAAKTLSYILSRTVHEHGTNPRPFYNKVVNKERLAMLKEMLGKEIADQIIIDFKTA